MEEDNKEIEKALQSNVEEQKNIISELLKEITLCNLDLLGFNEELGQYNYLYKSKLLRNLYKELMNYLDSKENMLISRELDTFDLYIDKNPVYKNFEGAGIGGIKRYKKFFKGNFNVIKKHLDIIEKALRILLGKYELINIKKKEGTIM